LARTGILFVQRWPSLPLGHRSNLKPSDSIRNYNYNYLNSSMN